ncbi:MAG TPA: hypothetical protein VKV33_04240 [Streptosporangiaceae bacterium]|uniref:Uncharacterized protein n=1 Tax=Acidothermus cellulolyticus (strain ATCC 43068 / DSM 8971 / 11B) TaxID=351607 RepID=A0LSR7_ACIC1|nr:hypothetical protein [Acidothermus cellulolyticus]ABK52477.1 hypothetical protein Acel_0704 [Acidothermus cellulolyticus 11B]HLH58343.1 hypothetical protein [Streptosporangiaceae bacterium]
MSRAATEFGEFAASFADPLFRLGYLLVCAEPTPSLPDVTLARTVTVRALLATRRHWRDVASGAAPESLAVAALFRAVSRPRRTPSASRSAAGAQPAVRAGDRLHAVGVSDPRAGLGAPVAAPSDDDAELRRALDAMWCSLSPAARAVFLAEHGVSLFHWMADLDLPDVFGHRRRAKHSAEWQAAWTGLLRQAGTRGGADVDQLLRAVLAERAAWPPTPPGVVPEVEQRQRVRVRWTAAVGATLVLALVAGGLAFARPQTATQRAGQHHPTAAPASAGPIVNWPVRGNAAAVDLVVQLRAQFARDHPDAYGPVQVLLVADVPWFRLAYVVARTASGVVNAWYYGPAGSQDLQQGYVSYGQPLAAPEGSPSPTAPEGSPSATAPAVVAAALADPSGHVALVALTAPQLLSGELRTGTTTLPTRLAASDGAIVADISAVYAPGETLRLIAGGRTVWEGPLALLQLAARPTASALARFPGGQGAELIPVQRGTANTPELFRALQILDAWRRTGELASSAEPTVLWGGADGEGTQLLILRAKTLHRPDLLIVVWGAAPEAAGEYLLRPDLPDYPLAFSYLGAGGNRIGVLTPLGVTSVGLYVRGAVRMTAPVDATGFATLPAVVEPTSLGDGYASLILYDAQGKDVGRVAVPPPV